mmetsp:Transcript_8114/g.9271  ORF Transcript_8114/g.9271 Transcript_8114/m.9271 type:complete len:87 (-) Transcript_8114:400-660(-)
MKTSLIIFSYNNCYNKSAKDRRTSYYNLKYFENCNKMHGSILALNKTLQIGEKNPWYSSSARKYGELQNDSLEQFCNPDYFRAYPF